MLNSGIMQTDERDCASACLATICLEFGIVVPRPELNDLIKIDQVGGTFFGLIAASKKLGLKPTPLKGSYDDFLLGTKENQFKLPCIANIITDTNMAHFIVINKVNKSSIKVFDPAKGDLSIMFDDMRKIWGGSILVIEQQKNNDVKSSNHKPYSKYKEILIKNWRYLALLTLFSVIISAITISVSLSYQYIIDYFVGGNIEADEGLGKIISPFIQNFWLIFLSLSLMYFVQAIINYIRAKYIANFTKRISLDLFNQFCKALLESKYAFLESKQIGDILSRSQTVIELQQNFSNIFLTLVLEIFSLLVSGIILFFLNLELFKIVVIMGGILTVLSLFFVSPIDKLSKIRIEQGGELVTSISSLVSNSINSRVYNQASFFKALFTKKVEQLIQTLYQEILIKNLSLSITATIQNVFLLLVILRGGFLISEGFISIGQLVSFQMIMPFFILPIKNLLAMQSDMQKLFVGMNKLNDILDCPILLQVNDECSKEELIILEDVSYSHNYQTKGIEKINIKIYPNEKICFFGENGSGKSTLLKLLIGAYIPDYGKVLFNKDFLNKKLKVSFVDQNSNFFPGTLLENISFGSDNFNQYSYDHVLSECGLTGFDSQFPLGLNTRIIENGSNLSGGQKQQLSIIRALYNQPDFLLLDESTSNIDKVKEKCIFSNLIKKSKKRSIVAVIHSRDLLSYFERIIFLRNGEIVKEGSLKELLSNCDEFKEVYYGGEINDDFSNNI